MSRGRSITEFAVLVILLPILAFPPASSTNDYQHEHLRLMVIHSKSWIRWIPESADNLEFSAERLSENAKNIDSAIC